MSLVRALQKKAAFLRGLPGLLRSISGRLDEELARQALDRVRTPFLPWSKFSIRPQDLVTVLNDVVANRRRECIELGAGISTVYLTAVLQAHGGRLVTLEHDPVWLETVRAWLEQAGLAGSGTAELVLAPLAPHERSLDGTPWYAVQLDPARRFDLALVDGPPGGEERELARYPAGPFLHDRLAPDYTVFLDDVNRPGERDVLERWARELGATAQVSGRMGLLVPPGSRRYTIA